MQDGPSRSDTVRGLDAQQGELDVEGVSKDVPLRDAAALVPAVV